MVIDGKEFEMDAVVAMVVNIGAVAFGHKPFVHDVTPDDGLLDLLVLTRTDVLALTEVASSAVFGNRSPMLHWTIERATPKHNGATDERRRRRTPSIHLPRLDVRWLKRLVPLVLLGLAVHLLVPQITGFSSTWQTVRTLKWWLVAVAFVMQFGSYVGSGILLHGLVRLGGGRLKVIRAMMITLASGGIGLVAAGIIGSSAATYGWMHGASGDDGRGAGLAATLKPVFNNALLLGVAVFASIHLLILGDLSTPEAIGFATIVAILAAIIGGLLWGATHPTQLQHRLTATRHRWARLRRSTSTDDIDERVQNDVNKLQNAWILLRTGGWKQPLVGASINTVFDATSLYVLFIAAGDRISIAALLTGYSIALLLGKATFLPGGVGVVEATMLTIYTSLGAEHPAAVVAVLESCGCLFTREGTHLDCANFGVVLCRKMASGSPATGSCRSGSPRYSRRPRRPEARLR